MCHVYSPNIGTRHLSVPSKLLSPHHSLILHKRAFVGTFTRIKNSPSPTSTSRETRISSRTLLDHLVFRHVSIKFKSWIILFSINTRTQPRPAFPSPALIRTLNHISQPKRQKKKKKKTFSF